MKQHSIILILLFTTSLISAQDDQVHIVNSVIAALKGDQGTSDLPEFKNMKDVCKNRYFSCNKRKKLTGLDLQFANLNGYIPENINQLKDLKHINLQYNYLSGQIPSGLNKLEKLAQLTLNGNFLSEPLPPDLLALSQKAKIDLSENTIKTDNKKYIKRLKITKQFNLEGCRSPDSIFLVMPENVLEAVKPRLKEAPLPNDTTEVAPFSENYETMPRFPGCETEDLSFKEKEECAKTKMLQFVYKNLRYPAEARENGIEGMVVVQFVIFPDGNIGYVNIVRDIGGRCGNACLWLINRINFICDRWIPGIQRGEKVKVLYTLPIKFKLQ